MSSAPWHFVVCGINHKSASVDVRQPLQINREDLAHSQLAFSEMAGVTESIIVSTCNRVEFYFVSDRSVDPFSVVGPILQPG